MLFWLFTIFELPDKSLANLNLKVFKLPRQLLISICLKRWFCCTCSCPSSAHAHATLKLVFASRVLLIAFCILHSVYQCIPTHK